MLDFVKQNWVELTAAAGLAVGAARLVIRLTPTQTDDNFWTKYIDPLLRLIGLTVPEPARKW